MSKRRLPSSRKTTTPQHLHLPGACSGLYMSTEESFGCTPQHLHLPGLGSQGLVAVSKAPERACGRGGMGRRGRRTRRRLRLENAVTRIAGERASTRRQASATYIYIKDPGGLMGGPCGFRIPMTRPVCARGAPKRRPSMHGANCPPALNHDNVMMMMFRV